MEFKDYDAKKIVRMILVEVGKNGVLTMNIVNVSGYGDNL